MAITSENNRPVYRGYISSQFRYAMTYVVITFVVLLILNIYCSQGSQKLFYQSKEESMIEKCQLASDEIATLDVINGATVEGIIQQMDSLKVSRLIVTDQRGVVLYDSDRTIVGQYALLPEILQAITDYSNVFTWRYHDGAMDSRVATPIVFLGNVVGCVYMTEFDTTQGRLIQSIQTTVLHITLILEAAVLLFALSYSKAFSRRMSKILDSMRIIQNGDYSHKLELGGGMDELSLLGSEINDLTERLQTSEQKRSRFVSDASHELKTPLASIKLLTDSILQNDMDLDTTREFVGDIGNEADRLNRMTQKLLSLTKVDSQLETDSEIIYMGPTVHRVARMLTPVARQADITLELDLKNDCPILILEDDLYQIVFNLMENGIKYNVPGGHLYVTLSHQEDNARLTVRDTGMGIAPEALDHIFERFYRVDKARSRATGGSGLGLAIVRAIASRNRGEIEVSSTEGQGTTFTVTFPAFDTEVDLT